MKESGELHVILYNYGKYSRSNLSQKVGCSQIRSSCHCLCFVRLHVGFVYKLSHLLKRSSCKDPIPFSNERKVIQSGKLINKLHM